jgi:hypothetical protein
VRRAVFFAIMLAIPTAFLVGSVVVFLPKIKAGLRAQLLQHMANNLTEKERQAIYHLISQQFAQGTNFWDAVPDPDVAELALRSRTAVYSGVEARINNAGMRAAHDFSAKPKGVFRIVCLGDSFVFGMGGLEEDRFCNQLEAFYRDHHVSVGGKAIEAYAVGLPGWSLVQEATYLATRITSYDPDVIIELTVSNDITDDYGVSGVGGLTTMFSPENRALGSATFFNELNILFGDNGGGLGDCACWWSALAYDLSPESHRRWDKALFRLKRLVELQQARGKHIVVSAMTWGATDKPDFYASLFQTRFASASIRAPFVMTSFLPTPATQLAHDSHPNRLGHRLLRDQYIHILNRLGWVTVPDTVLPELDKRTPVKLNPALDRSRSLVAGFRQRYLKDLRDTIDFSALSPEGTRAFLGGLLPEKVPAHDQQRSPWASLHAAFLLRRPQDRPLKGVEVEIWIPPLPELFPFSLKLLLDGAPAADTLFERPNTTGHYRISGAPRVPPFFDQVVEVTLETGSYFSTIDDARMLSYQLLRARVF